MPSHKAIGKMSLVKTLFCRIGQILLSIMRTLRKAICCRRKKESEYLLPMTVGHVIDLEQNVENEFQNADFKSQWEVWPDNANLMALNNGAVRTISENNESQLVQSEEASQEDFFKDMVPQIRKPKKIYIKHDHKDSEQERSSNRLAMDPKAILVDSDLGVIDDNPSNWEDSENLEDSWDPDVLIREKKRAEQEKRRADHQRRKMEKENRRVSKPESLSSMMLSLSDSKDKHKYS